MSEFDDVVGSEGEEMGAAPFADEDDAAEVSIPDEDGDFSEEEEEDLGA